MYRNLKISKITNVSETGSDICTKNNHIRPGLFEYNWLYYDPSTIYNTNYEKKILMYKNLKIVI